MIRYQIFLFFILFSHTVVQSNQTWSEFIIQDTKDTILTGMPVALTAAVLWYYANRIPNNWQTVWVLLQILFIQHGVIKDL